MSGGMSHESRDVNGERPVTHDIRSGSHASIANETEHCLHCFRLIRSGRICHLGKDDTVLCPSAVSEMMIAEDLVIQATEHLAVDCGRRLIRVRCESAAIIVKPGEVRHLVDALVEAVTRGEKFSRTLRDSRAPWWRQ